MTGRETIYDSKTDTFIVKGDAVMTQGGSVLKADEIDVVRRDRQAKAIGHVHLIDPEVEIWATEAHIDINKETLVMYDAKVLAKHDTYHLEGQKIAKLQGQNYQVTKGFFTTCGCSKGTPDWSITADQMDVNVGTSGIAKGGKFNVLGHPLVSLPFAKFPADSSRHSGFLSGREGQSNIRGFQWLQPYYLAINKSSDATAALDIETSQRIGGLAEYRLSNGKDDYLWVDGAFYDESIRTNGNRIEDTVDNEIADPHIPVNRYGIIGMTRQHLTDSLTAYADTISVSDSLYLREMNVWTLSRGFGTNFGSLRNAQSHFGLIQEFENVFVKFGGTWNQDLIQPQEFALQRLPQLDITGRQELFNHLMFADFDAQAVNFYRYKGVDGLRLSANPRVTLPWRFGDYVTGYGTVGSKAALYDTSGHNPTITPVGTPGPFTYNNGVSLGPIDQTSTKGNAIPYAKAGISTVLDRVYDLGDWHGIEKLKHTIEPFATYAYVPRITQGGLPLFDQMDRLNPRSLITYGTTMRLFGKLRDQPEEPDQATDVTPGQPLTERDSTVGPYHQANEPGESLTPKGGAIFREGTHSQQLAQLTIMQAYDLSHQVAIDGSNISDLEAILNIYPTSIAAISSQVDYNPRSHAGVTYANTYVTIQPPWSGRNKPNLYMGKALQGSFFQFGYNYSSPRAAVFEGTTGNGASLMTGRMYTDVFNRFGFYFAPSYDFAAQKMLSTQYGVRLKSPCDCWAADVGVIDSYNPNEVQVQFQLTLGGLGSAGRSPFGRNPFQTMGLAGSPTGVLPAY
ncbi:MAG: LPS assembly protein LptD [Candidatus Binatus sp.]|nr:LPS assembly protein LptD [Candidatus Binatus sp.]MDO8433340.1 LPS assembly protein LptD [Candidatus Binatus sp.]